VFRKDLKARLDKIFGLKKSTYDAPGESFEQDTLFIQIDPGSRQRVTGGKAYAKVTGTLTVFSQADKLPYGFFHKSIHRAAKELTSPIFFFDVDTDIANSPARVQNIHERQARFVFLWSGQYDPNQGELTELKVEC
jgi:hypothetical protein